MDSIFKLSRSGLTDLIVTGLELDNDEYLNEELDTLISVRNYAYSHSVTINTLSLIKLLGSTLITSSVVNHIDQCSDESVFKMSEDGLYEVSHIIIPNKKWFDYCVEFGDLSAFSEYKEIFYYDEDLDKIIKYVDGVANDSSLDELLNADAVDKVLPTDKVTTVIRSEKSTFNTYYLKKCYADICSSLLNAKISSCRPEITYKQDMYKRDILFMGISSIRFAIETQQFFEAQRILESLKSCANLCTTDSGYNNKCNCR